VTVPGEMTPGEVTPGEVTAGGVTEAATGEVIAGSEPVSPNYASRVDEMLDRARSGYGRVGPAEAARTLAQGGLLVDTRPAAQRAEFGEIPGAIVIERNVLEWRLDPTSAHRHERVTASDQEMVLFCQAGYASSLAVVSLRQLGLSRVTDLVGGYEAWLAAGLPTTLTRHQRSETSHDGHEGVVL
jgi:rhodanese-related sulfurtransferase